MVGLAWYAALYMPVNLNVESQVVTMVMVLIITV